MKASLLLLAASLFTSVSALAHGSLHSKRFGPNHSQLAKRANGKRQCKPKPQQAPPKNPPASSSPKEDPPKSTPKKEDPPNSTPPPPPPKEQGPPKGSGGNNDNGGGHPDGLIGIKVDRCGPNGASRNLTSTSGPNGSIDFLNCGVNSGGWKPPYMTVGDLISVDLADAINRAPFKACSDYKWAFEQFGKQTGLPPILLASFALQESSCRPQTVGGAGEQGLMQLTPDKCHGAPNGDCRDVGFNVRTGAEYFAGLLRDNNNDLLLCIGMYNGWRKGMTIGDATAQAKTCCRCQNNLDYIFQFLNGWMLGIDSYSHRPRLGKYFNLDVCGK